jgi:hypothetical protein
MVVMTEDGMLSADVTHDESGFHPDAPCPRHRAIPQPNFMQVIPRTSRTQRGGVSPSTATLRLKSFTLIACGIACTCIVATAAGSTGLILARLALTTIRAASEHFRHCCPGSPDAGGPLYFCL